MHIIIYSYSVFFSLEKILSYIDIPINEFSDSLIQYRNNSYNNLDQFSPIKDFLLNLSQLDNNPHTYLSKSPAE